MKMCNVIKQIRVDLHLSQMAFADELHVHFSTVNRWENDRAEPNPLATMALISLCEQRNVRKDLVDFLRNLK